MKSGNSLLLMDDEGCADEKGNGILRFSMKFKSIVKQWQERGYGLHKAYVNFIVFWKKQEDNVSEVRIILPKIILRRYAEGLS